MTCRFERGSVQDEIALTVLKRAAGLNASAKERPSQKKKILDNMSETDVQAKFRWNFQKYWTVRYSPGRNNS